MSLFFTADPHFSDEYATKCGGIIRRERRRFSSVAEMDEGIIAKWNSQAGKEDIIYVVGDFINYNKQDKNSYLSAVKLVPKINAKVILILGNQEERLMQERFEGSFDRLKSYFKDAGFYDVIEHGTSIEMRGTEFYLNHYPILHKPGVENLFGHIHSLCFAKPYGFNVGVDCLDYNLFSEEDIFEFIKERNTFYDENVFL